MTVPTIKFYPNKDKKSLKNGLIPIYLRIRRGNLKTEVKLEAYLQPNELFYWDAICMRLNTPENRVNLLLEGINNNFKGLQYIEKDNYLKLTPLQIKNKILPDKNIEKNDNCIRMLDFLEDHYKNVILVSSKYCSGTRKNYRKAINHIERFLIFKKIKNLGLLDFNYELASNFSNYLMSEIVDQESRFSKKSMSPQSASSNIIKLKTIFNEAVDIEKIKVNPFRKLKLYTKSEKQPRLMIEEVSMLYNMDTRLYPNMEIYKDRLLFQIFTGLSFEDFNSLKRSDIQISDKGYLLDMTRKKSNSPMKQYLVSQAVDLIKKYDNNIEVQINDSVLPQRHLNNYNQNLKVIAKISGINKPITSHYGRRTCIDLLTNSKQINENVMDTILGWVNNGSMRKHYNMVYLENLLDAKNIFETYLNEIL